MAANVKALDLPEDVVSLIGSKLTFIKDYVRFGAVCRPWRCVYLENLHRLPRQVPLLMLPTELNVDPKNRSFYSITEKKVLDFQVPVPQHLHCRGSSHGWLAMVDSNPNYTVGLFNPFISTKNNYIHLPPLTAFEPDGDGYRLDNRDYVSKVVLSANPTSNPNNYIVMAVHGGTGTLAFFLPGERVWKTLPCKLIVDVIYYRDQFYAVDKSGQVFAWDFKVQPPRVSQVGPPLIFNTFTRYLVESSGDLLQVIQHTGGSFICNPAGIPCGSSIEFGFCVAFEVFKLNVTRNEWTKMDSLNKRVLFLGDNSSLSLSASDFPECRPNSIYFTDDQYYEPYWRGGYAPHAMGVFRLDDRSVQPRFSKLPNKCIPVPVWVEPML